MANPAEHTIVSTMKTLQVTDEELQILKAAITALDLVVGKNPTEEQLAHLSMVILILKDDNENPVAAPTL